MDPRLKRDPDLKHLKKDMCNLQQPGALPAEVKQADLDQSLPPGLQYACSFWVQDLEKSGAQLCDNDHVHQFLQVHLLHWLEALSWMQKISEGIVAIASLESIVDVSIPAVYQNHLTNPCLGGQVSQSIRVYS
jgi:hypothetical protein